MSVNVPPSASDRLLALFRQLIRGEFPQLTYLGIYAYRVTSATGGKFSGSPENPATGLPPLANVPIRGPTIGGQSTLTISPGSSVGVMFLDGDPTRPVLVLGDDSSDPKVSGLRSTNGLTLDPGAGIVSVSGAGDFTAMAAKVDSNFSALKTYLDAHVHPTGVGPSGPPASPSPTPTATPSTKLKTD